MSSNLKRHIAYLIRLLLLVLLIFSTFRLILLFSTWRYMNGIMSEDQVSSLFACLLKGVQFDLTSSIYVLIIPILVLLLELTTNRLFLKLRRFSAILTMILLPTIYFISAIDISYFGQTFQRINRSTFLWSDQPGTMLGMIFQEFSFYWPIFPWLVLSGIHIYFQKRFSKKFLYTTSPRETVSIANKAVLFIMVLGASFYLIRGATFGAPINIRSANMTNYSYTNQLALNPFFSLFDSYLHNNTLKEIDLMDNEEALAYVRNKLNSHDDLYSSPIAREIRFDENQENYNVVLVLMEGLSNAKYGAKGEELSLTPNLDALVKKSYSFENFYSSGTHTFTGIYSTLTGFPSIMGQHGMNNRDRLKYNSLAHILQKNGYTTSFYTCAHGAWDNTSNFLLRNGFESVITEKDYPSHEYRSSLGVCDEVIFNYSLDQIDKLNEAKTPFFVTYMTGSNHGPYYIPDHFKAKSSKIEDQVIEYADWAIGDFMDQARNREWFDSTIFLFVSDHGRPFKPRFDMPLSFNQIPFIIYGEMLEEKGVKSDVYGSQIDIIPTVMSLLKIDYIDNTFGQNLFTSSSSSTFFVADDKYAVINDSLYLIINLNGEEQLYNYKSSEMINRIDEYPLLVAEMSKYPNAFLQLAQTLILERKTFVVEL